MRWLFHPDHHRDNYVIGLELMIHSISKINVLSSSYVKLAHPMHFFRHLYMLCINLSQNPHHQEANSTINLQLILLFFKWQMTSGE